MFSNDIKLMYFLLAALTVLRIVSDIVVVCYRCCCPCCLVVFVVSIDIVVVCFRCCCPCCLVVFVVSIYIVNYTGGLKRAR